MRVFDRINVLLLVVWMDTFYSFINGQVFRNSIYNRLPNIILEC